MFETLHLSSKCININFCCIEDDEYTNVSYIFRWAKASAAVKAGYQAKSDKDKARYAAEKAKFAAKK